jgi:ferrochelatase
MTAIVLLNTGTPRSCQPKDVKRYLHEFLLDDRVLDYPSWLRNLLVKGIIVPLRHKKSAKAYARIWQESGSPLMTNSQALAEKLQGALNIPVAVAMRYGEPSIHSVLNSLQKCKPKQICFVPLFPQYASATTGSIFEEIFQTLSKWQVIPSITTVGPFADHPLFLKA